MTDRDRDRDELIEDIVDGHDQGFFPRAEMIADHLIERGWRRTVALPEQESAGRLTTCPAHPGHAPFFAAHSCPWCTITRLQAGRATVSPEEVEMVAQLLAFSSDPGWQNLAEHERGGWIAAARAAACAFGLSVAEGETT